MRGKTEPWSVILDAGQDIHSPYRRATCPDIRAAFLICLPDMDEYADKEWSLRKRFSMTTSSTVPIDRCDVLNTSPFNLWHLEVVTSWACQSLGV